MFSELPQSSHLLALPTKKGKFFEANSFNIKFYQNVLNCIWISNDNYIFFSFENVDSKKNNHFKLAFAETLQKGFSDAVLSAFLFI